MDTRTDWRTWLAENPGAKSSHRLTASWLADAFSLEKQRKPDHDFDGCTTVGESDRLYKRLMRDVEPFSEAHDVLQERHRRALQRITEARPKEEETDPEGDAAFLAGVVRDSEHWTAAGIGEGDLAAVFEMSELCRWGSTYSPSRFRQAVKLLVNVSDLTKRGPRWYTYSSPTVETIDEHGARVCTNCQADITHNRASALYCDRCRDRVRIRRQSGPETVSCVRALLDRQSYANIVPGHGLAKGPILGGPVLRDLFGVLGGSRGLQRLFWLGADSRSRESRDPGTRAGCHVASEYGSRA